MERHVAILLLLVSASICQAQSWVVVRREVTRELAAIKPQNTKQYVYRVRVPVRPRTLPADIRVDLVCKKGHYDFEYTAVRFEKQKGEPLVRTTYFSFGSALAFWRSIHKTTDNFVAKSGTMSVADFDKLLMRAFAYYDSNIAEIYIPPKPVKRNGKWYYAGSSGSSRSWTSGDGSILLGLFGENKLIVKAGGSLYPGELKTRMDNGYEEMRPHLFWKVFYDHLKAADFLRPIPKAEIEALVAERLSEPTLTDTYYDYYRQALFVELLGEYGTSRSLEILKRVSQDSGLEQTWHEHIQSDVSDALSRISSRH